jgi:ComF family protein
MMIMEKFLSVKRIASRFRTVAQEIGGAWGLDVLGASDCLLCLEPVRQGIVCNNCERLLAFRGLRCLRCAGPIGVPGTCGRCLRRPPGFDLAVTAFDYRFPIDHLVHRFKFGSDPVAGAFLGDALAREAALAERPALLVPSPMSAHRLRERGFNPAAELARRVGRRLRLPVDARAVAKVRHTAPQAGLGQAERQQNLRGAFVAGPEVEGLPVAIVDDVMTTGATLATIAGALREAGATRVSGWVVARTPEPRED